MGEVLVEVEQVFNDGRARSRNMLVAEKMAAGDKGIARTAFRGIREELNLPADIPQLDTLLKYEEEGYVCQTETQEAASYPGLCCVYCRHFCTVDLLEEGISVFRSLGLLENEFTAKEHDKTSRWRWTPLEKAREDKVKGFPKKE